MSLRDQLLQKGLVSKKDVRKVEQELHREQRQREGNRRAKADEEAERAAAAAREAAERLAAKRAARTAYEQARERTERALQVRNLVLSNTVRAGGPITWHHRLPGRTTLGAIGVGPALARQLARGEVAIAALPSSAGFDARVVRRAAAERLCELAPELVVFWNRDPSGTLAPDQQPAARTWESSLGPHRATEADVRRFGGATPRP